MKRFAAACIIAALVAIIYPNMESNTLTVSAHRGRTETHREYHHNEKQNIQDCDYYYCDGHSAHLHEHGVCPYAESSVSDNSVSGNAAGQDDSTTAFNGRHGRHHRSRSYH